MKSSRRIFVGMPSGETVMAATMVNFATAAMYMQQQGWEVTLYNAQNTIVAWAQERLGCDFMNQGCEYLWLVDSDMTFPRDIGLALIARGKDIVGCDYRNRKDPEFLTAGLLPDGKHQTFGTKTGVEEVQYLATGMLMIRRRVLEAMERPWFWTDDNPAGQVGNDANFCRGARKAGFRIYCDFYNSRNVCHLGTVALRYDQTTIPTLAHDIRR